MPEPRPGSCVDDTRELPDRVLNFMRTHPMMDGGLNMIMGPRTFYLKIYLKYLVANTFVTAMFSCTGNVGQRGGAPVYYKRDVVFTRLVVDTVTAGRYSASRQFTLFYIGTATGEVYKVSQWEEEGELRSQLLDTFQATALREPVRAMEISRRRKMLYVTSDSGRISDLSNKESNLYKTTFKVCRTF